MLFSPLVALLMLRHVQPWVMQLCVRRPTIVFTLIAVVPASSAATLVECKARNLPMVEHVNKDSGSTLTSKLAEIAQH